MELKKASDTSKMKLEEAHQILKTIEYKPFSTLFSSHQLQEISKNKGKTGQLLEMSLGLMSSNDTLDFMDGELKSNKCDPYGNPKETIFITQICTCIDDLLLKTHFQEMSLYEKIHNILYVPVAKEGPVESWYFLPSIHIDLENPTYISIRKQLEEDYYSICNSLEESILTSPDGYIHTCNGKYLQIRCKDFKNEEGNYSPIYSDLYGRYISNKNHAFYFKRQFIQSIRKLS